VTDHLRKADRVPAVHLDGDRRDLRLDACRGAALWFIFIDHIPDNAFAWLTLRNYGFSDATEVFVFVSGYTCMLAYGGTLREQGWLTILARSLRRSFEIYAAFLLLVITYLALIWVVGRSTYFDAINTRYFFENPGPALTHIVLLQYTPVNTDILPTFAPLHLAFPLVLWLLIRSAAFALGASLLLYLMVQIYGWSIPAWPTGELYFKPLAWQMIALIRCGENSLPIYCVSVLMSFAGFVILTEFSGGLAMQAVVTVVGILLLILIASVLTWEAKRDRRWPKLF